MKSTLLIRPLRADDIAAVLEIQSLCYDAAKQEAAAAFLAKLQAAPDACFLALLPSGPVGYLVAVPAVAGSPPPLHSADDAVPAAANALYLHDLALHPAARGSGAAGALIAAYFHALRQRRLAIACLTAVNASRPFWERHGFRATTPATPLDTYGDDACYMSLPISAQDA